MQASSIEDHLQADAPPDAYIALGNLDSLTPQACWTKEEHVIKSALSQTLPNTAFLKVKGAANIKAAWDILKGLYEGRSKALVADIIRRFRNKCCEEDESVCTHFKALADLREQLAAMGKPVGDDNYTDTLFASLPNSYDSMI